MKTITNPVGKPAVGLLAVLGTLAFLFSGCPEPSDGGNPPTVTAVTVTPATITIGKGQTQVFTAEVSGENNPAQSVAWSVDAPHHADTKFGSGDGANKLTVAEGETALTLIVRAVSTEDTGKNGAATVTVSSIDDLPALTGSVSVDGIGQSGQTLTANTSGLAGSGTLSYQWKRGDGVNTVNSVITGAIGKTYTLTDADADKCLTVTVNRTGYRESVTSQAVGPILSGSAVMPSGVSVSPETTDVAQGGTQQFTAMVAPENAVEKGVIWIVEGGKAGTGITEDGLLTAASDETAASLTVKAVSRVDSAKFGAATVTVSPRENTFTVSFNSNGGSAVENQRVKPGNTISEPRGVTRTGYTLEGWYKEETFEAKWGFASDRVIGDMTLYAKWTAVRYSVSYNLNGGTQGANPATDYTIESAAVSLPNPTRIGYTFNGWYDNSGFTGNGVTQIEAGSTGNITLYAKWTAASYSISYNLNGGTQGANPATAYTIESAAVSLPSPTRIGYTFNGWYDNSGFTGSTITQIARGSSGDKEFWAKWTAVRYRVSYNLNGGTQGANPATAYTVESAVVLPSPARTGYTFNGWYDNSGFTGNGVTQIEAGSTGDKEFWAKWTQAGASSLTYYWLNEQGHIAFSNGASASITTAGQVIIAAQGSGYTGQQWYVNGVEYADYAGQASYTFSGAGRGAGRYAVGLRVQKGSGYYYAEFILTVTN